MTCVLSSLMRSARQPSSDVPETHPCRSNPIVSLMPDGMDPALPSELGG